MSLRERHPLLSYQPLRLIFQLSYSALIITRLPYDAAVALIPSWRPDPSWTAKQTFMTRVLYSLLDMTSRVGITETLTLRKGKEGERFQLVTPSSLDVYRGPLASKSTQPTTIGGTWFPRVPGPDVISKTVMLYFHGGAFIAGDGRDAQCGSIAAKLLEKGGADAVFSLQYRLSGYGGQNPFPASLQDALSSYLFLLNELHIPARQIILAGDSSGGNLAIALLRYLHQFEAKIGVPLPRCAVLLSPWVAPFHYNMDDNPHRSTDFIPSTYPSWGAHAYADGWPGGASDPYVTPLGNPFRISVPIFANAGTAELLLEDITQWVEEMRKVDGNVVELNLEQAAVHDTFLSGDVIGFSESAGTVATRIGEFVRRF